MLEVSASPEGEIHDPRRYILSSAAHVSCPHIISSHRHMRGQLLFSLKGNLNVSVDGKNWNLTPENAIWIQSGATHSISTKDAVDYRSVYVDHMATQQLPFSSGIVKVSRLTRELVTESASFGNAYPLNSPESRLMDVLFDQVKKMEYETMPLAIPTHPKLTSLCHRILENPLDMTSLADWGKQCGASERNLARLFKQQTGLSFTQWCLRVRALYAIERIKAGDSVTTVSINLGYNNTSAFSSMFKKVMGLTPRDYIKATI